MGKKKTKATKNQKNRNNNGQTWTRKKNQLRIQKENDQSKDQEFPNDKIIEDQELSNDQVIEDQELSNHQVIEDHELSNDNVIEDQELSNHEVIEDQELSNDNVIEDQELSNHQVIEDKELSNDKIIEDQELSNHQVIEDQELSNHQVIEDQELSNHQVIEDQELSNHQVIEDQELSNDKIIEDQELSNHQVFEDQELSNDQIIEDREFSNHQVIEDQELSNDKIIEDQEISNHLVIEDKELSNDKQIEYQELSNNKIINDQVIEDKEQMNDQIIDDQEFNNHQVIEHNIKIDQELYSDLQIEYYNDVDKVPRARLGIKTKYKKNNSNPQIIQNKQAINIQLVRTEQKHMDTIVDSGDGERSKKESTKKERTKMIRERSTKLDRNIDNSKQILNRCDDECKQTNETIEPTKIPSLFQNLYCSDSHHLKFCKYGICKHTLDEYEDYNSIENRHQLTIKEVMERAEENIKCAEGILKDISARKSQEMDSLKNQCKLLSALFRDLATSFNDNNNFEEEFARECNKHKQSLANLKNNAFKNHLEYRKLIDYLSSPWSKLIAANFKYTCKGFDEIKDAIENAKFKTIFDYEPTQISTTPGKKYDVEFVNHVSSETGLFIFKLKNMDDSFNVVSSMIRKTIMDPAFILSPYGPSNLPSIGDVVIYYHVKTDVWFKAWILGFYNENKLTYSFQMLNQSCKLNLKELELRTMYKDIDINFPPNVICCTLLIPNDPVISRQVNWKFMDKIKNKTISIQIMEENELINAMPSWKIKAYLMEKSDIIDLCNYVSKEVEFEIKKKDEINCPDIRNVSETNISDSFEEKKNNSKNKFEHNSKNKKDFGFSSKKIQNNVITNNNKELINKVNTNKTYNNEQIRNVMNSKGAKLHAQNTDRGKSLSKDKDNKSLVKGINNKTLSKEKGNNSLSKGIDNKILSKEIDNKTLSNLPGKSSFSDNNDYSKLAVKSDKENIPCNQESSFTNTSDAIPVTHPFLYKGEVSILRASATIFHPKQT